MNDDIFSHDPRVHVYVSNLRQIMVVPFYDEYGLSMLAKIYDYPIEAKAIGTHVSDALLYLLNNPIEQQGNQKKYWLLPRGVKSWNKFQDCSMLVTICIDEESYFLNRHYTVPRRGFYPESTQPDLTLPRIISDEELGRAILAQFDHIQNHPYIIE